MKVCPAIRRFVILPVMMPSVSRYRHMKLLSCPNEAPGDVPFALQLQLEGYGPDAIILKVRSAGPSPNTFVRSRQ